MSKALEEVELPYESTFSAPSGPVKEFPYIGEQGTFTQRRDDLLPSNGKNMPHLMHHVPLNKRGPYKLLVGENLLGERIHQSGYAMCNGIVGATNNRGERSQANPTGEPRPCKAKAINRSGYCSRHGGMLHPLDRKRIDWDAAPREIKWKFGKLPVDELDDEELSRGQIRKADGTWTDNNFVSAEVHDAMVKKLFERADTKLRENLLVAVDTMAEIAKGTAYEPADRIKAAQWMYERVRGKVPTEVVVSQDKPFEVVLADVMLGGSRAESRARRGIDEGTIDAEFVEELSEDLDLGQSVDEGQEEEELTEEYKEEDHIPLRADWVPALPVLNGSIGKPEPQPIPPSSMESRIVYEEQKAANEAKAQADREAFLNDAKAFKKMMNKKRGQRIASRNRGKASLPVPHTMEVVVYEDEPDAQYIVFTPGKGATE